MPALYLRTLRHLKPSQVIARLWLTAYCPKLDLRPAPGARAPDVDWRPAPSKPPRLLSSDRARFLNVEHGINTASAWNDPSREKLWLYNLHYFDDLARPDFDAWRACHLALMHRWVAENPPGTGNGWEPYPLSLRIANWIKWHLRTGGVDESLRQSLAVQARFLSRRLEYHLLGNHLLANAKALAFAGLFFEGSEGDDWRRAGFRLLGEQLEEQALADGGHHELSPMYHSLVLEDVLDLANAADTFTGALDPADAAVMARWRESVPRMLSWLAAMTHPDGGIAFFNDSAHGIAPTLDELRAYSERLGIAAPGGPRDGVVQLTESGYVRLETLHAVLLTDVGPVGPDFNPGHAHADTLSFELSLFGQRVIVNGGTSQYGKGPEREAERGTPAHSTVTVNNENSSEVWDGFRVARRARPFDLLVEQTPEEARISCAHDGYKRLPGKPVHRRAWRLRRGELRVEDRIEGRYETALARYHFHPSVEVVVDPKGLSGVLRLPDGKEARWRASNPVRIEQSHYAPEFGRKLHTRCLALALLGPAPAWLELSW